METQALPRIFPACPPSFLPDRGEGKRSRHGNLSVTFRDAKNSGEKRKSARKKKGTPKFSLKRRTKKINLGRSGSFGRIIISFSFLLLRPFFFIPICLSLRQRTLFSFPESRKLGFGSGPKGKRRCVWWWVWKRGRGRAERSCAADNP